MKKLIPVLILVLSAWTLSAQNVGVGTSSPNTKLDVNGAVTFEETPLAVTTAGPNNLPPNVSQVQLTVPMPSTGLTGPSTLSGPSSAYTGQILHIYNNSGYAATFTNAGSISIPAGVAMEFIYSNSTWVPTSPASSGGTGYIQNQHTAAQGSSSFWISGDGQSTTSFTTPLLQSGSGNNLNVTSGDELYLNTGVSVPSMHLYNKGGVLIENVSTLATPNPGLQIDMTNGTQAGAIGLQINKFPASSPVTNARTGIAVDMTNTQSSTGIALTNIGATSMTGITIDADANGDGTGITLGGAKSLLYGINITGGTGITYNALNSGSGTAFNIGGTKTPNVGVNAVTSGTGALGGSFLSSNFSTGTGLVGGVYSSSNTISPPAITGVFGYASSNSTTASEIQYGVYAQSARGGNATGTTSYGLYAVANGTNTSNNGMHVAVYGAATVVNAGTSGSISGLFNAASNSGYQLALAANGGADVYLGSTAADIPSNFQSGVLSLGSGTTNQNNTYMYNSRISGTQKFIGSTSGIVGITAPATVTSYTITLPAAAPSATLPVYMTTGGALTFTGPTSGTNGYWSRNNTTSTLSPTTSSDAITTTGAISTTSGGTITSSGLLTGAAGATISGAATSINASSNFNTSINTGTSTGTVTVGNSASTTTVLGTTNINNSGAAATNIAASGTGPVYIGNSTGRVGIGNSSPGTSAILDLTNSGTLGLQLPTVSGTNPASPAGGMVVYNSSTGCLQYWNGSSWVPFGGTSTIMGTPGAVAAANNYTIYNHNGTGVFTLAAVSGAMSYVWSLSSTASASITNQSGNSCTVTFSGAFGTPNTVTVNCTVMPCSGAGVAATGLSVQYGGTIHSHQRARPAGVAPAMG